MVKKIRPLGCMHRNRSFDLLYTYLSFCFEMLRRNVKLAKVFYLCDIFVDDCCGDLNSKQVTYRGINVNSSAVDFKKINRLNDFQEKLENCTIIRYLNQERILLMEESPTLFVFDFWKF